MVENKSFPKRIGAIELSSKGYTVTSKIIEYIVTITTGPVKNAGTDAKVHFEIAGHSTLLDKPNYNDFERRDTDSYSVTVPAMTLDDLRKSQIRLFHDNTGKYPGWYVQNVDLKVRFANTQRFLLYKRWGTIGWLAKDEGPYYTTEAILQDGTELSGG